MNEVLIPVRVILSFLGRAVEPTLDTSPAAAVFSVIPFSFLLSSLCVKTINCWIEHQERPKFLNTSLYWDCLMSSKPGGVLGFRPSDVLYSRAQWANTEITCSSSWRTAAGSVRKETASGEDVQLLKDVIDTLQKQKLWSWENKTYCPGRGGVYGLRWRFVVTWHLP